MAHCVALLDRRRSRWICGAAIETMVWSMKVIATAKIIAVRTRPWDRPPKVSVALMGSSPDDGHGRGRTQCGGPRARPSPVRWLRRPAGGLAERGRDLGDEQVQCVLLVRQRAQRGVVDDELIGARVAVPADDLGDLFRRSGDDRRRAA